MDKRIQKTRAAIRQAYFSLLLEKDMKRVTISDIARRANIDRKTFYLHYESVDDIIQEFYREKAAELITLLKSTDFSKSEDPIQHLFEIFNGMINDYLDLFKMLIQHPEYNYFFKELSATIVDVLIVDCRDLFPFTEEDLKIYATFYISGIVSVYLLMIKEEQSFDAKKLSKMVSNASVHGLSYLMHL